MLVGQWIIVGVSIQTVKSVIDGSGRINTDTDDPKVLFWSPDRSIDLIKNICGKEAIPVERIIISVF